MANPRRGHRAVAALLSALALTGCGGDDLDTRTGFLVDDGETVRLCEALAESFPPQCGGDSVAVEGEPPDVSWNEAQGVRWTDVPVTLRGELEDGVLRIAADGTK